MTLGSNYWKEQGARIIAREDAAHEIEEYGAAVLGSLLRGRKDRGKKTVLVGPDIIFTDRYDLSLGGGEMQVLRRGPAHSPGDTQVYLPQQKRMIAGDLAFNIRMLPVFAHTDTKGWLETGAFFGWHANGKDDS